MSDPYEATAERRSSIEEGRKKLRLGMPVAEVETLMGVPDEIDGTFDAIKNGRKIGSSLVYVLARAQAHGSEIEKGESLVRLHFDLGGALRRIDVKEALAGR